jgi:GNAT superfamily N-acetyltransferase
MDLSSLNFKAITASDKDSLLLIMEKYYESDHLDFSKPKAAQAVAQLLEEPNLGQIWLIEQDSEIIGYVAMTYGFGIEFGGRVAWVDEFFIEESHRGKGVGTAAVQWCMQKCHDQGILALRLEVTPTNPKALALYTRLGFIDYRRNLLTYKVKSI